MKDNKKNRNEGEKLDEEDMLNYKAGMDEARVSDYERMGVSRVEMLDSSNVGLGLGIILLENGEMMRYQSQKQTA